MNRREVIVGGTAILAATAIAGTVTKAIASPSIVVSKTDRHQMIFDKLIINWGNSIPSVKDMNEQYAMYDVRLLQGLVKRDLFEFDKIMSSPTMIYDDKPVIAVSRAYKHQVCMPLPDTLETSRNAQRIFSIDVGNLSKMMSNSMFVT